MAQLNAGHIVGYGPKPLRLGHHLFARDEKKIRLRVDELADEPGAGDPVDLDPLAGDPFHAGFSMARV